MKYLVIKLSITRYVLPTFSIVVLNECQTGVGIDEDTHKSQWFLSKMADEAFGTSVPSRIRRGYEWLVDNCTSHMYFFQATMKQLPPDQEGDKICLFGFSRGAYIARSVAGMLAKVRVPLDYINWFIFISKQIAP